MGLKTVADLDQWLMIDLFIQSPGILNWNMETLEEIPDNYLEEIFSSHSLEHVSHNRTLDVLKLWWRKLAPGGRITIVVPDIMYAFEQLKKIENYQVPDGYYNDILGQRSPLNIIYGTHSQAGEYHLTGFTEGILNNQLVMAKYTVDSIETIYDSHQMDCLVARAQK